MLRPKFVQRKLHLIAEDLGRLVHFKDDAFATIVANFIKLTTVERLLERIVMRAIDINEHLISELATGQEDKIARLTYRNTFLKLTALGIYPPAFAEQIAKSAGLRDILVHDYNDVDRHIVYNAMHTCLEAYQQYIDYILAFLDT